MLPLQRDLPRAPPGALITYYRTVLLDAGWLRRQPLAMFVCTVMGSVAVWWLYQHRQWRRQDLLRGGAKLKITVYHGALTADFRAGCSSCSSD